MSAGFRLVATGLFYTYTLWIHSEIVSGDAENGTNECLTVFVCVCVCVCVSIDVGGEMSF